MAGTADVVTILGELTFAEQIAEIAQYNALGKQGAAVEQERAAWAEKASSAGEDAAQQKTLVNDVIRALNSQPPADVAERELEGVYNLVSALIAAHFTDQEATVLVEHVTKALAGIPTTTDRYGARYRILANLFNALPPQSPNRCTAFRALLDIASTNDDLDLITDAVSSVPRWLAEWQIDAAAKADVLRTVAAKLQAADDGKAAYHFQLTLLRFLGTSTASGQGASASTTKEAAEQTIALALGLPYVFDFEELAGIEAVQNLKGSPVGQLLDVFLNGNTKDFASWKSANSSESSRLKLSDAQLERKIRLLDLADLCAQSGSGEVAYGDIAKSLNISEDDVEVWAIDVIRAGLVAGKLSQIKQSLRVYKSVSRRFGAPQWKLLEDRLTMWDQSIANIIDTIADAKSSGGFVPRDIGIPGADASTARQGQQQITA